MPKKGASPKMSPKAAPKDRQQSSPKSSVKAPPKKDGGGGKFTMGKVGEEGGPQVVDRGDPNYDSEAERDARAGAAPARAPIKFTGALRSLLWLSPNGAQAVLKTIAQLLKGAVPCTASDLVTALKGADTAVCEGLLADAELRAKFVEKLAAQKGMQISSEKPTALVAVLEDVLEAQLDATKTKAAALAKKFPAGMPSYSDVAKHLPAGEQPSMLKRDYILWHALGNKQNAKAVPLPAASVLRDRLALAACAGEGPVAECGLALHVLENANDYVTWEASCSSSKPPREGIEVKQPFTAHECQEVALRRILSNALPTEVATAIATDGAGADAALERLAKEAYVSCMIPLYAAPPAPKEAKDKKGGKDEGGKKADGGKKDKGSDAPAATAVNVGSFSPLYNACAGQELQWQLLRYCVFPGTALSKSDVTGQKAASAVSAKVASTSAKGHQAGVEKPKGFGGIWAPLGSDDMPPGHTPYSWLHSNSSGAPEISFGNLWKPLVGETPPGHTPHSWELVLSAEGSGTKVMPAMGGSAAKKAASPKSQPQKASPKKEAAPKKDAAPKKNAASKANSSPEAPKGGDDEAAVKAIGDELRVLKEKLKGEGVSGKKMNDHPEVKALVEKLTEVKKGSSGGNKKDDAKAAAPVSSEEERKKKLKKVIKEGGKRGVEIEGAADMGGLRFFSTSVDEPDGDADMLVESMQAMNNQPVPGDEERKGCSGHIGKTIFSAGTEQLAVVSYVPKEEQGNLNCKEWLQAVLANFGGELISEAPDVCVGRVKADGNKGVFPLKIREPMILEANNFLRKKGLFPEDDSDDDEMVFGDDDFPS